MRPVFNIIRYTIGFLGVLAAIVTLIAFYLSGDLTRLTGFPAIDISPDAGLPARSPLSLSSGANIQASLSPDTVTLDSRIELTISTNRDIHLRVIHFGSDDSVTELFPGSTGQEDALKAGDLKLISWKPSPPAGVENVILFASEAPITNRALKGQKALVAGDFVIIPKDQFFTPRGRPTAIRSSVSSNSDLAETRLAYRTTQP